MHKGLFFFVKSRMKVLFLKAGMRFFEGRKFKLSLGFYKLSLSLYKSRLGLYKLRLSFQFFRRQKEKPALGGAGLRKERMNFANKPLSFFLRVLFLLSAGGSDVGWLGSHRLCAWR